MCSKNAKMVLLYTGRSWNAYTPKRNLSFKGFPFKGKSILFRTRQKNITFWLLSSLIVKPLWNKIIIYSTLLQLNKFRLWRTRFRSHSYNIYILKERKIFSIPLIMPFSLQYQSAVSPWFDHKIIKRKNGKYIKVVFDN